MPAPVGTPQTLYDKVFSAHIVDEKLDGTILLYIGMWFVRSIMLVRIELTKLGPKIDTWSTK